MKAFEWASPATINEAVQLLKSAPVTSDIDEAARPIAGGQDRDVPHAAAADAPLAGDRDARLGIKLFDRHVRRRPLGDRGGVGPVAPSLGSSGSRAQWGVGTIPDAVTRLGWHPRYTRSWVGIVTR